MTTQAAVAATAREKLEQLLADVVAVEFRMDDCVASAPDTAVVGGHMSHVLQQMAGDALREAEAAMKERAAMKIEEQSQLLTDLFGDCRHEALCRDFAAAIRALE